MNRFSVGFHPEISVMTHSAIRHYSRLPSPTLTRMSAGDPHQMLSRPLKVGDIALVIALEQASFPPTEIKEIVGTTGKVAC